MVERPKPVFDGATLSPKIKPKKNQDPDLSLPIGKFDRVDGKTVARHYKHAAGKSNTYAPAVVDMIYHMARSGHFADEEVCRFVAAKLDAERDLPAPPPLPTLDQLVFLSANLTRLVIDPYREKCNSRVRIGPGRQHPLILEWPIVLGGLDFGRLPKPLLDWTLDAAAQMNTAIIVDPHWKLVQKQAAQRIVRIDSGEPLADLDGAAGVLLSSDRAGNLTSKTLRPIFEKILKQTEGKIPIGITAPAANAAQVVDETIELGADFYLADAQWIGGERPNTVIPEVATAPAIHVLADTVERLRYHCREETVAILYSGGIRGGADAAKALCIGATAVSLGLSSVVGMGFKITNVSEEQLLLKQFEQKLEPQQAIQHLVNFAKSVNIEVTMLARACGKSSVTNMEPEDLRAMTIAVSAATGIPVAGKDYNYRTPR